jgi:secondary thiamine-phosphate synthase enzyme
MKALSVATHRRTELLEFTREVQQAARAAGWADGTLTVFVPHTTAGVTINEHADPDVARDLERRFDEMVPWDDPRDRHGEGNTAAHLKTALVGTSAAVFLADGRLQLGTWQGIFLCEFDGPRTREVWLQFAPAAQGSSTAR